MDKRIKRKMFIIISVLISILLILIFIINIDIDSMLIFTIDIVS